MIHNYLDVTVGTLISQVRCERPTIFYHLVKNEIVRLESEFIIDLKTFDSFMGFISKKASIID